MAAVHKEDVEARGSPAAGHLDQDCSRQAGEEGIAAGHLVHEYGCLTGEVDTAAAEPLD